MALSKAQIEYIDKLCGQVKDLWCNTEKTKAQIAKQLEVSETTVRRIIKDNKFIRPEKPKPVIIPPKLQREVDDLEDTISEYKPKEHLQKKNQETAFRQLRSNNETLLKEYEDLMAAHEIALALQEPSSYNIPVIQLNESHKNQAVPLIQFSDWHVEERVDRHTTHGKNEYNPDIARKRVEILTENTIKLIHKEQQNVIIENLFICLGGDMINSFLHEHDVQENYMSPIEACKFAKELICKSLATIAEYSGVKHIDVMCIRGNHPRLTKKMISNIDYKMNLEAMIYDTVKQDRLMREDIFTWHIPQSEFGYIDIGGKTIRNFHGHQVNYKGGIGGITIPLIKYIMRLNDTIKADYTTMHHFHTLDMIGACNTSINGSLVGFNSYAMQLGAKFEEPKQAFQLLDTKRGFTVRTPIHCQE